MCIGLIEGSTTRGRLTHFDPQQADVKIAVRLLASPRQIAVPRERIAYVGIGKGAHAPKHGATPMRVHLTGGHKLEVLVNLKAMDSPSGFFGTPCDPSSAHAEVYFFAHAVLAKERLEPLGQVLVDQGTISERNLEAGVAQQAANQATPLGLILVETQDVPEQAVAAAAELQGRKKMRIGEILVEEGFVNTAQIELALLEQKKRRGKRLGEVFHVRQCAAIVLAS